MREPEIISLEGNLLKYVVVDSQSDIDSIEKPSTPGQVKLLRIIEEQLNAYGIVETSYWDFGALFATIPPNTKKKLPTIGFIAHVDTAPDFSGKNVKPIVHRNYQGETIILPDDESQILEPNELPYLASKIGHDIVTASGRTLLGADDKSGVSILVTLAEFLSAGVDFEHGPIRLAFSTDEEIGTGITQDFSDAFGAHFAYSLDGGEVGNLEIETFSADMVEIEVKGVSAHPGYAKGKMVNALQVAAKIVSQMPEATMSPQSTENRDGFIHVYEFTGNSSEAKLTVFIRDFEIQGLKDKCKFVTSICENIEFVDDRVSVECKISKQYRNMRYKLDEFPLPVQVAKDAYEACRVKPNVGLIRGGTDGSKLTEFGIPTPNLFTGMQNFHGPKEWVSLQDMLMSYKVCLQIVSMIGSGKYEYRLD